MATRSTTKVEAYGEVVVNMYKHWDGYPDGHGVELASFLYGIEVIHGLGRDRKKVANGMDDLAAMIVAHFKQDGDAGDIYLVSLDREEEFNYFVYEKDSKIYMRVDNNGTILFDMTPADFLATLGVGAPDVSPHPTPSS